MGVIFEKNSTIAHLRNEQISYVIEIVDGNYLVHRYFGKALKSYRGSGNLQYFKRAYCTEHEMSIADVSFDDFPFEYPTGGHGDYRISALSVTQSTGIEFVELSFVCWKAYRGKPGIPGLPSVFADEEEAETLEILCEDKTAGLQLRLFYSIFEDRGIIARHQEIENTGSSAIKINKIQSFSLELPAQEYDFISLYGNHVKEGNIQRFPLHRGIQRIDSSRGSSSPQSQPFLALAACHTTQDQGEIYGFQLVYSGNYAGMVEKDQFGMIRTQFGINPDTFCWNLDAGEHFSSPEAILNYSEAGINGMSRNFHWLYKNHLMPKTFANKERPILLNSWESMYYDVTLEKIEHQAELAKKLGMELFVLDDGWFRSGNTSNTSMGDWKCNEKKLPGGIEKIAELLHKKGLKFGLWFEPEAISEDSDLYRKHPEWVLQIPGYRKIKGRHEFLLDLSRKEVREYLRDTLSRYLDQGWVDYVKWDMNRPLTDVNSLTLDKEQKGEISHRYVLGFYELLGSLTSKFPDVLFEGCSSGGARIDPGMFYYVPQNWASDNTDAYDRSMIQRGLSMLYPQSALTAHVSMAPNHQTGRYTSLNTRYQAARLFNLGYELDLSQCSEEEHRDIKKQIEEYKRDRSWIMNGTLYNLNSPNDNYMLTEITAIDKDRCIVVIMQKLFDPLASHVRFKLQGLSAEAVYREKHSGESFGGDELMYSGVSVPLVKEDFHAFHMEFEQVKNERS